MADDRKAFTDPSIDQGAVEFCRNGLAAWAGSHETGPLAMTGTRLTICAAALMVLATPPASAEPAYVKSTVHLRAAAGTSNESLAKIPAGSLVDAKNCAEGWCEVEWKDKKGFSIATALDLSGRVPIQRRATRSARRVYGPVVVGPPVYYRPRYYYYGYRPYWGYRRWWY
jgi:uncharacterized protein YraI